MDKLHTMTHAKVGMTKELRGRKDYKRAVKHAGRALKEAHPEDHMEHKVEYYH
jgi:hypothetical protein